MGRRPGSPLSGCASSLPVGLGIHHRIRREDAHPERGDPGLLPIGLVYDEPVDPTLVHAGDARGGDLVAQRLEHPVRRALERPPADDGAHRDLRSGRGREKLPHPRHGEDRTYAHDRIRGTENDGLRTGNRLLDFHRDTSTLYPTYLYPRNLVPLPPAHEVLLELQQTGVRLE